MTQRHVDVAIVGAGIVGLAHAYAAARAGLSVIVFERSPRASGASVRNFGMIWPIGQPPGTMLQLALRSREIWLDVLAEAGLPHRKTGSLHAMYRDDESAVAREFADLAPGLGYRCQWLDAASTAQRSQAVVTRGLQGALWSETELTVDPRQVLASLPVYLEERYGIEFQFGCAVHSIDLPAISAGGSRWQAERAIVCSGDDFVTLYPDSFAGSGIGRCKLQMLRTVPQPGEWQLGPSLAGGLTLQHYAAFQICSGLAKLKKRISDETPELNRWGIHILVSQTADGGITIGDSHEYGLAIDVFDKIEIDRLILEHARGFLALPDWSLAERWHGFYAKHPERPFVAMEPAKDVRVITATGGAGMTLSFGLGEQTMREMGY